MSFDQLLGNEQLKRELFLGLSSGNVSHCYLISGPRGSGKHTLARLLAAGILCRQQSRPCLRCPSCRKVMSGLHPDLITWEDPEHQKIPVKMIREVFRPQVFIKPNESEYKVCLIHQEMGVEGQNALLKILEEPPGHAVFLLLSDNPEKLLVTVRSRCRELKLRALPEKLLLDTLAREFPGSAPEQRQAAAVTGGGFLGQARELMAGQQTLSAQTEGFLQGFAGGDALALVSTLAPMEKWKRDSLIPELNQWLRLLEQALVCRSGGVVLSREARYIASRRSSRQIHAGLLALQKAVTCAQGNVSVGAVCGYLSWALRG